MFYSASERCSCIVESYILDSSFVKLQFCLCFVYVLPILVCLSCNIIIKWKYCSEGWPGDLLAVDGAARGGGGEAGRAHHGLVPRPQPRHHHHLPRDTQGGDQQPRDRRHPIYPCPLPACRCSSRTRRTSWTVPCWTAATTSRTSSTCGARTGRERGTEHALTKAVLIAIENLLTFDTF